MKELLMIAIGSALVNNVVLSQFLGICPFLGVSKKVETAAGMGAAVIFVITLASFVTSVIDKVLLIPLKMTYLQTIVFILVIACLVQFVEMFLKKNVPSLYQALGVFLPLIVVNCIILGRAEMFASKNKILPSIIDGLGMGVGFTAAMLAMGIIRELLGAGTVFGLPILSGFMEPIIIFLLPPGGFFVFGMLIALSGKLSKEGKAPESTGCAHCPLAASCSKITEKEGK